MKHLFKAVGFGMMLAGATSVQAQITETATEAVQNMGVGWNLGNTLDAHGNNRSKNPTDASYWNGQGLDSETYWGQARTQEGVMQMMKNAGFGAIRVPVTWYNHMTPDGTVDEAWMQRVHEVVDYVVGQGLYCIINVHHDTGADGSNYVSWVKADEQWYSDQKSRYEGLWRQIAEEFRDYDEHLLMEAYNEMLDVKSSWCFASFAAQGNYNASIATSAYKGINGFAQSFVNTVRATGGNNATRNLIVSTYAAACGAGTWNSHLIDPLTQLQLPEDVTENHLICEVHTYPQIADRTWNTIKADVDQIIDAVDTHLASKGAPVIFGEWGTNNVDAGQGKTDYDVRRELMFQFVTYFVQQTKAHGMGTFYWMGLTDGNYRLLPAFSQADLAECIVKAYHGEDFEGEYPVPQPASSITVFEGEKTLGWGNGITVSADVFDMVGEGSQVEVTYSLLSGNDTPDIQLYDGWWQTKPSFTVDGTKFTADFNPASFYGMKVGDSRTTTFCFDVPTVQTFIQKGLIIHGTRIMVTRVVVTDPSRNAIEPVRPELLTNGACYDLMGRKVSDHHRGLVIKPNLIKY